MESLSNSTSRNTSSSSYDKSLDDLRNQESNLSNVPQLNDDIDMLIGNLSFRDIRTSSLNRPSSRILDILGTTTGVDDATDLSSLNSLNSTFEYIPQHQLPNKNPKFFWESTDTEQISFDFAKGITRPASTPIMPSYQGFSGNQGLVHNSYSREKYSPFPNHHHNQAHTQRPLTPGYGSPKKQNHSSFSVFPDQQLQYGMMRNLSPRPSNHGQNSRRDSHFSRSISSASLLNYSQQKHSNHGHVKNALNVIEIEEIVIKTCMNILQDALNHQLKAVELANTLRARVGTEILAFVREQWGGLLSLLEKQNNVFRVDRIPKNDMVTLRTSNEMHTSHVSFSASIAEYHSHDPLFPFLQVITPSPTIDHEVLDEMSKFGKISYFCCLERRNTCNVYLVQLEGADSHSLSSIASSIPFIRPWESMVLQSFPSVESHNNQHHANVVWNNHASPTGHFYSHGMNNSIQFQHRNLYDNLNSQGHQISDYYDSLSPDLDQRYSFDGSVEGRSIRMSSTDSTFAPDKIRTISNSSHLSSNLDFLHTLGDQINFELDDSVILRRLCDDTYVPTQAWPIDVVKDGPFCEAVIQQLVQFRGSTSISKLRGFLRNRLNAPDNIKSVPLKALLAAYPHLFEVQNNQVTLLQNKFSPSAFA